MHQKLILALLFVLFLE
ncbi:hypothetical protein [Chryseobacterium sp. P1-3]